MVFLLPETRFLQENGFLDYSPANLRIASSTLNSPRAIASRMAWRSGEPGAGPRGDLSLADSGCGSKSRARQ
jgi:hypothetical protein